MLYTNNHTLPDKFREDNGYNLCLLWFLTKYGEDYNEDLIDEFDKKVKGLEIKEVPVYKVLDATGEIIKFNGKYHVGDGYGNPIYSPCRDKKNGGERIELKLSVKKKKI